MLFAEERDSRNDNVRLAGIFYFHYLFAILDPVLGQFSYGCFGGMRLRHDRRRRDSTEERMRIMAQLPTTGCDVAVIVDKRGFSTTPAWPRHLGNYSRWHSNVLSLNRKYSNKLSRNALVTLC